MRFKDFLLLEAKHRIDISVEKAIELLRERCSDALEHFDQPIWRGSRGSTENAYLIQGDAGGRSSANTSNYYTVIIDEFYPKRGYPKRGLSIICANAPNKNYARSYGNVYAIFPYDGTPIGVCPEEDIWHVKTQIGNARREKTVEDWNSWFESNEIPDYSFEDMVNGIKETMEDPEDDHYDYVTDVFGTKPDKVEEMIEDAYDPRILGIQLATPDIMHKLNDKPRELWIGGRCIALSVATWKKLHEEFLDDGGDELSLNAWKKAIIRKWPDAEFEQKHKRVDALLDPEDGDYRERVVGMWFEDGKKSSVYDRPEKK